jgi:hypothetical protein
MSTSDVSYLNNGRGAARIFKNCQALFSKKRRKKRSPTVYCRTSNFSQFVKSLNLLALVIEVTHFFQKLMFFRSTGLNLHRF